MTLGSVPRLLLVGAFPPPGAKIYGGMVSSGRALLRSSLPQRAELVLVDSTQVAHPVPGFPKRLLLAARRSVDYVAKLESKRPDAVILFTAAGASVLEKGAMAWYARLRGVPALMFPRGGPVIDACRRLRFTRFWVRWAFRGARVVLCQGPVWQDFAVSVLGLNVADAPIVPNWTASDDLLTIGRNRSGPREPAKLLFVGWLDREKGVEELLQACLILAGRHQFSLTFVGEGNMSDAARSFVAAHNLSNRVTFRGWLDRDPLSAEYEMADVFVLPSWSEGLPNAMIEAMAAGLAIVVSDVGNVSSAVTDGHSALLVPSRNVDGLSAALARLIDDPALRAQFGANAHATAAERFGVEPAIDGILAAVSQAAPLRPGARSG